MNLRGWGHSIRRLSPCAISRCLRNTRKTTRFSLKHTHTLTWTEADKQPPSSFQHLSYLWPFNYAQLRRQIHPFIFFVALHYLISQSVSWILPITKLLAQLLGLLSLFVVSWLCPVAVRSVRPRLFITRRWNGGDLLGAPALISEIYSVQEKALKGGNSPISTISCSSDNTHMTGPVHENSNTHAHKR